MVGQQLAEQYPALIAAIDQRTRRLHHARPAPAAHRAGRGPRGPARTWTSCCRSASAAGPAAAGGAPRRRPAHRRNPGVGRRPLLQPVAVQPRHHGPAPAGFRVQAVRLPRRVREGRRGRAHGHDAGHGRHGRADDVPVRRSDVRAAELRGRVRRPDHAPARARPLAQHRHGQGGRDGGLRHGGQPVEEVPARAWRPSPTRRSRSGVFEATPFEIATAYTVFPNLGQMRPLRAIRRSTRTTRRPPSRPRRPARSLARPGDARTSSRT